GKVTRGQMAAFLHRMAKESGKTPASAKYNPKFWDVQNHMFKNDIGWLSSKGITTGYTTTSFKPDTDITRGEMAAFLYRFYSVV
ncbi:S-layer homology domain-containing protein, partial [Enterobacter asburiae]